MTDVAEALELQRCRWRHARQPLKLVDPTQNGFATGGLGRMVEGLSVRFLILPSDPESIVLEFDNDLWTWWMEDRPNPFKGASRTQWGVQKSPTVDAAVRYDRWDGGRWQWDRYLGLNRNGGIEFGMGGDGVSEWPPRQAEATVRGFHLSQIVGRVWCALALYELVVSRFGIRGPWEVSLALVQTEGALMGNVAAGWKDFDGWRLSGFPPTCPDPNLLIRRQMEKGPTGEEAEHLAFRFGSALEDAWGVTDRRFLVHPDHEGAGGFDPSRYRG